MRLALIVLALGCTDPRRGIDAGRFDSGVLPDAARPDAAMSTMPDAAMPDAAMPDAAIEERDGGRPLTLCQLACSATSECTTASPAFDTDNYSCESGRCRYTGCVDDAECRATFSDARYICRDLGALPLCTLGCDTASECTTGSAAFDADNYRCDGGACVYEGCNDDGECTATFGGSYGCRTVPPPQTPVPLPLAAQNCVRLCTQASDCASDSGAFSADNYECRSGACVWTGCNDDDECRTSLAGPYVCRP